MNLDRIPEFASSRSTLKKTSLDSKNGVYLSDSSAEVYNFDNVKKLYFGVTKESDVPGKSVDAILVRDNIKTFIEFKNCRIEKNEIRIKISDSIIIFNDLTDSQLSKRKEDSDFILVYSAAANPLTTSGCQKYIEDKIAEKAGKEIIRFELNKYDGTYFRKLHTYNEREFKDYLKKHQIPTE